jgi:hypothetical protein
VLVGRADRPGPRDTERADCAMIDDRTDVSGTGAAAAGRAAGAGVGPRGAGAAGWPVGVSGGPVAAALWAALGAADAPVTARQLADAVGTRRESANRFLLQLERVGWAQRERGDMKAGVPDVWSPTATTLEARSASPEAGPRSADVAEPQAEQPGGGYQPALKKSARRARMRVAGSTPPPAPGVVSYGAPLRLAAGELEEQVHELLLAQPGEEFSTLRLARMLGGRSQGAVANACKRLVAKGEAACSCQAPLRFTATSQP